METVSVVDGAQQVVVIVSAVTCCAPRGRAAPDPDVRGWLEAVFADQLEAYKKA